MKVTIGIKAFNEETHIAASLESAINAVRRFDGEVILADCGSTDRTIEIAKKFSVRILQLVNTAERSCGSGAQLAFQSARGDYFYLLDGDMVLQSDFVPAGIAYLEAHPDVAGVGGHVRERNTEGEEFQIRIRAFQHEQHRRPSAVDRLDGGGLFRTSAVNEVGYFADRNLHGFEEFELGARLGVCGWKLARIDLPAADHYGHTIGGYRLLWRRIRSNYVSGSGEVLRSAVGKKQLRFVLTQLHHIRNGFAVILWWLSLIVSILVSPYAVLSLAVMPLLFLSVRRRSPKLGLYSLVSWNANAYGLLRGFMHRRVPPESPLKWTESPNESKTKSTGILTLSKRDS